MGGPGSGGKPRDYPSHIVALARQMYADGMTVAEMRAAFPKGYRVQTIVQRYIDKRRPAVPRDQTGPRNPCWLGDAAGYAAFHRRVETARGKPSECEQCGTTSGSFEWANLTRRYEDVNDYKRMCVPCHRAFDYKGRRPNGQWVSLEEVMPNV